MGNYTCQTQVGEVEMINADQANDTLAAAQKGFEYWSALTLIEREKWILKLRDAIEEQRDEIIELLMAETGKLYSFALDDYQCLIDHLGFHIESAKQLKDSSIVDINGGNQHLVVTATWLCPYIDGFKCRLTDRNSGHPSVAHSGIEKDPPPQSRND